MVCNIVALLPRTDHSVYYFLEASLLHLATVHSTSSDYVTVSKWVLSFYHCIYHPDFPDLPFLPDLLLSFTGKCSVQLLKQQFTTTTRVCASFLFCMGYDSMAARYPRAPSTSTHVVSLIVADAFVLSTYGKLDPGFFLFWHVATVLDAFVSRRIAAMV